MTKTVAPVITALFGSVIRPVSDASADCAWSMPRRSTPSISPRTNLRIETPIHFCHVVRYYTEISSPRTRAENYHKPVWRRKKIAGLSDPEDTADIAIVYQLPPNFLLAAPTHFWTGKTFAI